MIDAVSLVTQPLQLGSEVRADLVELNLLIYHIFENIISKPKNHLEQGHLNNFPIFSNLTPLLSDIEAAPIVLREQLEALLKLHGCDIDEEEMIKISETFYPRFEKALGDIHNKTRDLKDRFTLIQDYQLPNKIREIGDITIFTNLLSSILFYGLPRAFPNVRGLQKEIVMKTAILHVALSILNSANVINFKFNPMNAFSKWLHSDYKEKARDNRAFFRNAVEYLRNTKSQLEDSHKKLLVDSKTLDGTVEDGIDKLCSKSEASKVKELLTGEYNKKTQNLEEIYTANIDDLDKVIDLFKYANAQVWHDRLQFSEMPEAPKEAVFTQ